MSLNAMRVKYALKNFKSILPKDNLKCEIKEDDTLECDNKNMISLPSNIVYTIDFRVGNTKKNSKIVRFFLITGIISQKRVQKSPKKN